MISAERCLAAAMMFLASSWASNTSALTTPARPGRGAAGLGSRSRSCTGSDGASYLITLPKAMCESYLRTVPVATPTRAAGAVQRGAVAARRHQHLVVDLLLHLRILGKRGVAPRARLVDCAGR